MNEIEFLNKETPKFSHRRSKQIKWRKKRAKKIYTKIFTNIQNFLNFPLAIASNNTNFYMIAGFASQAQLWITKKCLLNLQRYSKKNL